MYSIDAIYFPIPPSFDSLTLLNHVSDHETDDIGLTTIGASRWISL